MFGRCQSGVASKPEGWVELSPTDWRMRSWDPDEHPDEDPDEDEDPDDDPDEKPDEDPDEDSDEGLKWHGMVWFGVAWYGENGK